MKRILLLYMIYVSSLFLLAYIIGYDYMTYDIVWINKLIIFIFLTNMLINKIDEELLHLIN